MALRIPVQSKICTLLNNLKRTEPRKFHPAALLRRTKITSDFRRENLPTFIYEPNRYTRLGEKENKLKSKPNRTRAAKQRPTQTHPSNQNRHIHKSFEREKKTHVCTTSSPKSPTQIQTYQKKETIRGFQPPQAPYSPSQIKGNTLHRHPWPYLVEAEAEAAASSPLFRLLAEMEAGEDGEQTEGTIWSDPRRIYLAPLPGRVRWGDASPSSRVRERAREPLTG